MEPRRRAMRDDQKQLRRQALIDAAWQLFTSSGYPAITMAGVAEHAGLAKGTLYLYFNTKEELFLAVLAQQFQAWMDELDARLAAGAATVAAVAEPICDTLARRAPLVRLLAILHTILEHNIELASALEFKQMLRERLARTGALLEAALPALGAGNGPAALLHIYALIIGIENLASPAPVVRAALRQPGMELFDIAFGPAFAAALVALLRGLARPE